MCTQMLIWMTLDIQEISVVQMTIFVFSCLYVLFKDCSQTVREVFCFFVFVLTQCCMDLLRFLAWCCSFTLSHFHRPLTFTRTSFLTRKATLSFLSFHWSDWHVPQTFTCFLVGKQKIQAWWSLDIQVSVFVINILFIFIMQNVPWMWDDEFTLNYEFN